MTDKDSAAATLFDQDPIKALPLKVFLAFSKPTSRSAVSPVEIAAFVHDRLADAYEEHTNIRVLATGLDTIDGPIHAPIDLDKAALSIESAVAGGKPMSFLQEALAHLDRETWSDEELPPAGLVWTSVAWVLAPSDCHRMAEDDLDTQYVELDQPVNLGSAQLAAFSIALTDLAIEWFSLDEMDNEDEGELKSDVLELELEEPSEGWANQIREAFDDPDWMFLKVRDLGIDRDGDIYFPGIVLAENDTVQSYVEFTVGRGVVFRALKEVIGQLTFVTKLPAGSGRGVADQCPVDPHYNHVQVWIDRVPAEASLLASSASYYIIKDADGRPVLMSIGVFDDLSQVMLWHIMVQHTWQDDAEALVDYAKFRESVETKLGLQAMTEVRIPTGEIPWCVGGEHLIPPHPQHFSRPTHLH
jgi:hypothetical protein